jgi:hypothetical protein
MSQPQDKQFDTTYILSLGPMQKWVVVTTSPAPHAVEGAVAFFQKTIN